MNEGRRFFYQKSLVCGKKMYPDLKSARTIINVLHGRDRKGGKLRPYPCHTCKINGHQAWHITKAEKNEY